MALVRELLSMPERSEALAPPAVPGQALQASKFHLMRRRQLQDLSRAFKIKVPDGATKEQLVRFMTQAEESGAFRSGKPKSTYHLLHAELDHDLAGQDPSASQQEAIRAALVELEAEEFPAAKWDPPPPPDGRTIEELRAQAQALGINTMAKNSGQLRRAIALAEKGESDAENPDS